MCLMASPSFSSIQHVTHLPLLKLPPLLCPHNCPASPISSCPDQYSRILPVLLCQLCPSLSHLLLFLAPPCLHHGSKALDISFLPSELTPDPTLSHCNSFISIPQPSLLNLSNFSILGPHSDHQWGIVLPAHSFPSCIFS